MIQKRWTISLILIFIIIAFDLRSLILCSLMMGIIIWYRHTNNIHSTDQDLFYAFIKPIYSFFDSLIKKMNIFLEKGFELTKKFYLIPICHNLSSLFDFNIIFFIRIY